jgi:hypothetical protein
MLNQSGVWVKESFVTTARRMIWFKRYFSTFIGRASYSISLKALRVLGLFKSLTPRPYFAGGF